MPLSSSSEGGGASVRGASIRCRTLPGQQVDIFDNTLDPLRGFARQLLLMKGADGFAKREVAHLQISNGSIRIACGYDGALCIAAGGKWDIQPALFESSVLKSSQRPPPGPDHSGSD
jgi:hypothetical protein